MTRVGGGMIDQAARSPGRQTASQPSPLLTMLTVCIRRHHDDLHAHIALMDRLNPGFDWRLVVIDNSGIAKERFVSNHPRVEVREGVALDGAKPLDARFSYHHGSALNANLADVTSRYLLVLDPDLFVLYPNWMTEAIAHMRDRDLEFFGVPWHPRWYTKYRYFPAVHFLLIDLQRVRAGDLDFCPELVENPSWSRRHQQAKAGTSASAPMRRAKRFGWRMLDAVYRAGYFFLSRQLLGSSRDTGWKIWHRFASRRAADIVLPVVDIEADFTAPAFLTTRLGRAADALFPVRYRFLPKRGSYVSPNEAASCGLAGLDALRAEGFVWRGKAFAAHRRGFMQRDSVHDDAAEAAAWCKMLSGCALQERRLER